MKYYFELQVTRVERWFREIGVHPILGAVLALILFVGISAYLFYVTEYAVWLYAFLALSVVANLGAESRTHQLQILFGRADYLKVRLLENSLMAVPFVLYLVYERQWLFTLALFTISALLVFSAFVKTNLAVIPTPFRKYPFENIVGFRKSVLGILLLYFLVFKGIQVGNYNLAVVSFGALFLLCMTFHAKPEPRHFVWIFADTPKQFLKRKVIYSAISSTILGLPALVALGIFFPSGFGFSALVYLVGQLFLLSMIFAKYSAYPNEINVPQAILYGLSLWFPPMLIVVCIIFYKKSLRNLSTILR